MASFLDKIGLADVLTRIKNAFVAKADTQEVQFLDIDSTPTANSTNLVTSGGVAGALAGKQDTIVDLANIRSGSQDNVKHTQQALTDAQKEQARTNIGATAPEIFWAEYGTTTLQEVTNAYNAGKLVMCKYQSKFYTLSTLTETYCYFTAVNNTAYYRLLLNGTNWSAAQGSLEVVGNKVTSLSSSSTDTQYPSAKLVYDSLAEKQDVIDANNKLDYSLIDNTPTIPAAQVNSDWNASSGVAQILNKPDLTGFITNSVNDLINYYKKTETYTQTEINNLIGAIQQFRYEIVANTSAVSTPANNVLYLIGPTGSGADKYEEYVYANSTWTKIGDTSIDLSGYVTTTALNTALADYALSSTIPTALSDLTDDSTHRTVTDAEKEQWIPRIYIGTCGTAAATVNKVVTVESFPLDGNGEPLIGTLIGVKFTNTNSATAPKLNVNEIGAKSIYYNSAEATSTSANYGGSASRYCFYVWDGTYWVWVTHGTDTNDNTLAYNVRYNAASKTTIDNFARYRILFTSADDAHWVPSTTSTSTNATASRTVNQTPINPFGQIVYYGSTTAISANGTPGASVLYTQYALTLGYSFNRTGAALTLTTKAPVYIKCAPQSNGSAIIDADIPYVQALPSTEDGKIYIYLGIASSATAVEMSIVHPVYYYKDGLVRPWTNQHGVEYYDVIYDQDDGLTIKPQVAAGKTLRLVKNGDYIPLTSYYYDETSDNDYWTFSYVKDGVYYKYVLESSDDGRSVLFEWDTYNIPLQERIFASGTGNYSAYLITDDTENTEASGNYSLLIGHMGEASGNASMAQGLGTLARGNYSHTEGNATVADGVGSHAEGRGTLAQNAYEHSEGYYNVSNTVSSTFGNSGNTLHSIGIGSSNANRANALEIMQNGDTYIKGVGSYNGTTTTGASTLQTIINNKYEKPSTGIPASDIASGVIPEIITFTYDPNDEPDGADIIAAIEQGKIVYIEYDNAVYPLVYFVVYGSSYEASFGVAIESGIYYLGFTYSEYDGTIWTYTYRDVPALSTNIATDKTSNIKAATPKAVYDEVHPAVQSTQPQGGFLPNVEYNLGTLTGNVTFALASAVSGIGNKWYWSFTAGATAPTITWPTGLLWPQPDAEPPTIEANDEVEVEVKNGHIVALVFKPTS